MRRERLIRPTLGTRRPDKIRQHRIRQCARSNKCAILVRCGVNAFAMANGCIRVYSGLMDMMTDNEVEAVLGHEMGHVALGHVKKGMQVALGTNAIRVAAASAGGIVGL